MKQVIEVIKPLRYGILLGLLSMFFGIEWAFDGAISVPWALVLLTIIISLVLAFTSAPDKVKTTVSVLTGIGGIIYPLTLIIMGYRTPALGPDGADAR